MASTWTDNGFINYTLAPVVIGGNAYLFDTIDHDIPGSEEVVQNYDGTYFGSAGVVLQEKVTVKIYATTGTPRPPNFAKFAVAFDGDPSKNWKILSVKISSSTGGLRTYTAEITQSYT